MLGSGGMPRLAVRVSRDPPLLPVGDGGGNGRIGGEVGAGLGVRHCPNIGTILVGGGAARVLKVTGGVGPSIVEVRRWWGGGGPQADTRYTEGCGVQLAPRECLG